MEPEVYMMYAVAEESIQPGRARRPWSENEGGTEASRSSEVTTSTGQVNRCAKVLLVTTTGAATSRAMN